MDREQKIAELKAMVEKDPGNIEVYIEIAEDYRKMGEFALALEYYKKAEELAKNNPEENKWYILPIFNGIGIILTYIGRTDEALSYFMEGLKIAIEENNTDLVDTFLFSTATALGRKRAFDELRGIIEDILERNPKMHVPSVYNNLAIAYYGLGDYDKAIYYYNKALEMAEEYQDFSNIFLVKINLGRLYTKIGDYTNAEKYLLEALKDVKKIEDKYLKAGGYATLGMLYKDKGDKKTAKKLLNRASTFYKSAGAKEMVKKILKIVREL